MKELIIIAGSGVHNSNSAASARMMNYARSLVFKGEFRVYFVSIEEDSIDSTFTNDTHPSIFTLRGKQKAKKEPIRSQWRFLNSLKTKFNDIHEVCFLVYPQLNCSFETIFLIWAKRNGIKNIFCEINEVRRYWSALATFNFYKRFAFKSIFFISERYSSFYKGLICINKNIQHYYSKYNSNSLIVPILSPSGNLKLKENYKINSILKITFTGTIDVEKENLKELICGLSLLSNHGLGWKLILYGSLNEYNKKRIFQIAENYNVAARIEYKGRINQDEVQFALKESDCLILSRNNNLQNYYGFSTKLSEYLVSGIPVILTKTGVVEDYLTDGVDCIFVDGYEGNDFENAFTRFIALNENARKSLAEHAYLTAKSNFSPERYSNDLTKFLTNI